MSDYYNLEKAAEVLGRTPGDLNRLRESGKIRAFRDGSTWKFRKEDIDGFLTDEIKARSSSLGDDGDDDLLNDTDDEDMPTMMAETNTFDLDANVEIKARDIGEAEVTVADGDDDDYVLSGNTNDHQPGSSSISLDADDDDFDDFASGISILDEPSGSNVDLASDSGLTLSDSKSGSGSGISILEEDDEEPEPPEEKLQDDFELNELQLDPLPSENEPSTVSDKTFDQPAPQVSEESGDNDVFELQPLEEDAPSSGDTYGIAGDSESDTATRELETINEDFDLQPSDREESDSESSSQMIDIDEETQSIIIDEAAGQSAGGIDLSKETKEGDGSDSTPFGAETEEVSFDDAGFGAGFGGDEFVGFDSSADGESSNGSYESPEFQPVDSSDGSGYGEGNFNEVDDPVVQGTEASAETQKAHKVDASGYSGLAIWLALVPCILLLILSGVGIWELVRSMWSWEQPFSITGPVLETIGNMFKLFN